jgi:hypothetical protein
MRFRAEMEDEAHWTVGLRGQKRAPAFAAFLTLLQAFGFLASLSPLVQAHLVVVPDAILLKGQLWRLAVGPFVPGEFSIGPALFTTACVFIFGWHLECAFGRRSPAILFLGGSIFAAAIWSMAALVWDWKRPLFSPVGPTSLAVGTLMVGFRRPFPSFLHFRFPGWIAFVAYVAVLQLVALTGAIDLSAHFLAGLFAILVGQASSTKRPLRTVSPLAPVTTEQPRPDPESAERPLANVWPADPDFDRRVDDLLRKITEAGYDSLLEDEIALLLEASLRYRDRPPRNQV